MTTKIRFLFTIAWLMLATCLQAQQQKFTISGAVTDQKTGETIIGATVWVKELPTIGAVTNGYGLYSLTLPGGNYTLVHSFLGYDEQAQPITLNQNLHLDVALVEGATQIQEVVVTVKAKDENVTQTQVGMERIELKQMAKMPVLFGERDMLKSIQLLPGVNGAAEGNSGFYVRGGTSDQNLILLDDAPVYNASHLMGFFSTFNSDAIKDMVIYKGNGPAHYGGRLSSVLDVKMNDGNNQNFSTSGGLGLIASRLNIEGPIQKGNSSFIVSGRRSYADLFLKLSNDETTRNSKLYFYDLNAKINYKLSEKDRLFLSGYFGRDVLGLASTFGMDWGNATGTVRWSHVMNDQWFSNTTLVYSDYSFVATMYLGDNDLEVKSKIQDWNLKQEFQYYPNSKNKIRFGVNSIYHTVTPGQVTASEGSFIKSRRLENRLGWENALFISDDWTVSDRFSLIYGVRLSTFSALGPGTFYRFSPDGELIGSDTHASGEFVKTYINPEPRVSANFLLTATSSIKAGYARNTQYLNLISNSSSASPSDMWLPSSPNVKPQIADQLSLGYFRNFSDNRFEFSVEGYYKNMQHQIDYRDGADVQANELIEGELLFGRGRAYGLEFLFKKSTGRFSGWVSYTLSRTEKQIDGINKNNWYPARQDRTHDISIVGLYSLTPKWDLSAVWVFNTGNAVTFPAGKYTVDDNVQFYYTQRNAQRMPAYHRLDLGATWYVRKTKSYESSWNFSLYNAYGRENAYFISFRDSKTNPGTTEAVQTTLFRWVPSVTYNFKF